MASIIQITGILKSIYEKHGELLLDTEDFKLFHSGLTPDSEAIMFFVLAMEVKDLIPDSIAENKTVSTLLKMIKDFQQRNSGELSQESSFYITLAEIYANQFYLFNTKQEYYKYFIKNKSSSDEILTTMQYVFARYSVIYSLLLKGKTFRSLGLFFEFLYDKEINDFYNMVRDVSPYQTGTICLDSEFHSAIMSFPQMFLYDFNKENS